MTTTTNDIVTNSTVSPNPYESTTTTNNIVTDSMMGPYTDESSTIITSEDVATTTDPALEPTTTSNEPSTIAPTETSTILMPTLHCNLAQATRKYRIKVYNRDVSQKDTYHESVLDKLST
ncbi:hypothetical protein H4R33_007128, partial [Dimargaris cristalligena]